MGKRLTRLVTHRPETARGQKVMAEVEDDVIDGPQLIELAERELLSPLDIRARNLILGASKRVSVVTAVSPRALVDLGYVLFEVVRLVRGMAELYGGRPGSLGMLRLLRDVIAQRDRLLPLQLTLPDGSVLAGEVMRAQPRTIRADRLAAEAGLDTVMDRCVKIEHARLFGGLNWAGVNTKVISAQRPKQG